MDDLLDNWIRGFLLEDFFNRANRFKLDYIWKTNLSRNNAMENF